jgi:hypothetical protein
MSPVNLAQLARTIDVEWMRADTPLCAVCGLTDARALTTTSLADGTDVVVCGSHELTHRRAGLSARTAAELATLATERRRRHRRVPPSDELAGMLSDAFAGTRRVDRERRRTG